MVAGEEERITYPTLGVKPHDLGSSINFQAEVNFTTCSTKDALSHKLEESSCIIYGVLLCGLICPSHHQFLGSLVVLLSLSIVVEATLLLDFLFWLLQVKWNIISP